MGGSYEKVYVVYGIPGLSNFGEREREREYMEVLGAGVCCGARETEKERKDNLFILQKGKAR